MTNEVLKKKTERYLNDEAMPAEKRQIQNWLSCTANARLTEEEKAIVEDQILAEIKTYTAYPLFQSKPDPWWRKFTAMF